MTTNTFDTEESNSNISSPQYYVDDDGSLKFISPVLSSSNFDGSVPVFEGQITADALSPGKFIKIGEEYFPIISVSYDDQELEEDPSEEITVTYLDSNSEVQEIIYNLFDDVDVKYENWDEKYLGTEGWSLTYGGNAIFTNVAVRGDLEATTLDVGGVDGITYDGETVTIGASVVINAPLNIGDLSASYTTFDFITASYADINDLQIPGQTIINGGNITTGVINASLITTGALSGWTIDTNKIYTSQMTFDSANSRISVGPTNSPIGILEKDIAGTGISLRCDATTTAYGGTFPLARIDVTDAGSTSYGSVTLQAVEFFGRGGAAQVQLVGSYPFSSVSITGYTVYIGGVINTIDSPRLNGGATITNVSTGNTVASISNTGVFTGNGSGLTNIPAPTSIPASSIDSGTLADARIPNLAASKITSGTFADARIPNLAASKITSGVFARARVENVQQTGFSNSQAPLYVRTSDGRVGTFTSTINIKENIIPLTGIQSSIVPKEKDGIGNSGLKTNPENIFNITPVEYSIVNEDNSIKEVGFIVEDLLEKWPAAVTYDKNGKPHSYNTNSIVAGLVYAVSSLKNKVEELQNRVVKLESNMETNSE